MNHCKKCEVDRRFEALEALASIRPTPTIEYSSDKPKLAGAIVFLGFVILFCTGCFLHWHFGWLIAIGIFGSGLTCGIVADV